MPWLSHDLSRVQYTLTTTGTGNIPEADATVANGFQDLFDAIGGLSTDYPGYLWTPYTLYDNTNDAWEYGLGRFQGSTSWLMVRYAQAVSSGSSAISLNGDTTLFLTPHHNSLRTTQGARYLSSDVTSGGSITLDLDLGNTFYVPSGGKAFTINIRVPDTTTEFYFTVIVYDTTNSPTITWNFPNLKWTGGVAPSSQDVGNGFYFATYSFYKNSYGFYGYPTGSDGYKA